MTDTPNTPDAPASSAVDAASSSAQTPAPPQESSASATEHAERRDRKQFIQFAGMFGTLAVLALIISVVVFSNAKVPVVDQRAQFDSTFTPSCVQTTMQKFALKNLEADKSAVTAYCECALMHIRKSGISLEKLARIGGDKDAPEMRYLIDKAFTPCAKEYILAD